MYRLVFLVFFVLITGIFGTGCAEKQQGVQISETRLLLDTYCTITIHGDINSELLDEAFAICAELEALFSITIEGSDVWQINHNLGEFIVVNPRTLEVINAGLDFGELSEGMFDISLGRLTRLWDFGSGERNIPTDAEIIAALGAGSYKNIHISGDKDIVWIEPPDDGDDGGVGSVGIWIDLGAIAKGYIADKIAGFLIERGVSGAMIDLGGDVVTVGNRQDGNPWRIALRKPFGSMDDWIGIVEASNVAVVSSGIYERQFEVDGVLYHHILDPNTGMPAETDVVSAVVIAESGIAGEGLSTIAVLAGSDRAPEYFEKVPGFICAVLVLSDGEILVFGDTSCVTIR